MRKIQNKGITLIALVITIIVLLILAGVSISMLTGENGILQKIEKAKKGTIIGEEKEQIELAYAAARINKLGDRVEAKELQEELKNKAIVTNNSDGTINVVIKTTKNNYILNNGIVSKVELISFKMGLNQKKYSTTQGKIWNEYLDMMKKDMEQYGISIVSAKYDDYITYNYTNSLKEWYLNWTGYEVDEEDTDYYIGWYRMVQLNTFGELGKTQGIYKISYDESGEISAFDMVASDDTIEANETYLLSYEY